MTLQKKYTEIPNRQKCINKEHPFTGGAIDIYDDKLEKPQEQVNEEILNEIGADDTPDSIKGRVKNLETEVGSDDTPESIKGRIKTIEDEIGDDTTEKSLSGRIKDLEEAVGDGGSVDERIAEEGAKHYLKSETYNKTELNSMITTPDIAYKDYDTYADMVAETVHPAGAIYRVANYDGTQAVTNKYAEYSWDGTQYKLMAVRDHGVDDKPTAGSDNLVKSDGVYKNLSDINRKFTINSLDVLKSLSPSSLNTYIGYKPWKWNEGTLNGGENTRVGLCGIVLYKGEVLHIKMKRTNLDFLIQITDIDYQSTTSGSHSISVIEPGWTLGKDIELFVEFPSGYSAQDYVYMQLFFRKHDNSVLSVTEILNDLTWFEAQLDYAYAETSEVVKNSKQSVEGGGIYDAIRQSETYLYKNVAHYNNHITLEWLLGVISSNGKPVYMDSNRIISKFVYYAFDDVHIRVIDANFRVSAYTYTDTNYSNRVFSGWETENLNIAKGSYYMLQIARVSEVEAEISDIELFSNAISIYFMPNIIDEKVVLPKILNLKTKYFTITNGEGTTPFVMLHFSDIHADEFNLSRIMAFRRHYSNYIDETICTGDLISSSFTNPFDFWNNQNAGDVLTCIGNHDGLKYIDNQWVLTTSKECYDKFFAPYISNWGVVQPEDAASDGKCYYYKDYASKSLRLIVLDCMHYDTAQDQWMQSVLNDALTNNLHVIACDHYEPFSIPNTNVNTFNTLDVSNFSKIDISAANNIRTYINEGGVFVCWLFGHTHYDVCNIGNAPYNNQLCIGVPNARRSQDGDMDRTFGVNQDCFNLFAVDTYKKQLKIMRIGADYDRLMRYKNVLCWDYENSQLIINN